MNVITSHNTYYDINDDNNNNNNKIESSSITKKEIETSISSSFSTLCSISAINATPSLCQSIHTFRSSSRNDDNMKDIPPKYPRRCNSGRSDSHHYYQSTTLYIISDDEDEEISDDHQLITTSKKTTKQKESSSSLIGKTIVIIVNQDSV